MTVADIEQAVSDRTAAIMLYLDIWPQPSIAEVAPIARKAGVPLIVDAAAELPPRRNLTEPLKQGADLVIFSGGKGVFGPQGTGLVVGKKELIEACRLNGNPHNAIGRPMKVGKEDIAAFITALELFMGRDEQEDMRIYAWRGERIVRELAGIPGIDASVCCGTTHEAGPWCRACISTCRKALASPRTRCAGRCSTESRALPLVRRTTG